MTEAKLNCGCIVERGRQIRACHKLNCEYDNYLLICKKFYERGNLKNGTLR